MAPPPSEEGGPAPAGAGRLVRVVPDVPAIRRRFDYVVTGERAPSIRVGDRVRIALHGRRVGGWVVEVDPEPVPGVAPRPVIGLRGLGPPADLVSVAEWAAWQWAGPVATFLRAGSPPRIVESGDVRPPSRVFGPGTLPSPGGESPALVDAALGVEAASSSTGVSEGAEGSKGVAAGTAVRRAPGGGPVVVRIAPLLDEALLVFEIVHRLGAGGVLVLAPTVRQVHALADRLRRATVPVAVLPDEWASAAAGGRVVVGARAAAWAPVDPLRAVVVLSAHDQAYREERTPTWWAVDVAVERARRVGAPCIMVTPCPTVAVAEGRPVVTTSRPAERRGWPPLEVVDRRGEDPRSGLFSEAMVRAVRAVLDEGGRVAAVLDRTGRVRLLSCVACGTIAACSQCGGRCEQPEAGGDLRCSRCGSERPAVCASCDSRRFRHIRIGVSKAAEELAAVIGHPVAEITAASSGSSGSTHAGSGPAPGSDGPDRLVIGTQAVLHRVGPVDLVVFLDFDQHLLARRYTAAEDALALIVLAARSLTGGQRRGRLIVQTRQPDHPVLRAAAQARPELVLEEERDVRRLLGLPPFGALARLSGPGASAFAASLRAPDGPSAPGALGGPGALDGPGAPGGPDGIEVSDAGPDVGPDGTFLVRAADMGTLADALGSVAWPGERLRLEVDPVGA